MNTNIRIIQWNARSIRNEMNTFCIRLMIKPQLNTNYNYCCRSDR